MFIRGPITVTTPPQFNMIVNDKQAKARKKMDKLVRRITRAVDSGLKRGRHDVNIDYLTSLCGQFANLSKSDQNECMGRVTRIFLAAGWRTLTWMPYGSCLHVTVKM